MSLEYSPGEVIAERYLLEEMIGSGGMSTVYRCKDLHLNKLVALKIIRSDILDQEAITRFHREAKAVANLKHQNIIEVFDFIVTDENQALMIMELIEGLALDDYLEERDQLAIKEVAIIAIQVCHALDYAHKNNIFHRDIKPSNILICTDENQNSEIKVLDFGIAKVTEIEDQTLTKTGFVLGTPTTMSPEQASGKEVDARSDIYSLGCLIFYLLTGKYPLKGNTSVDTLYKQLKDKPPLLEEADKSRHYPKALTSLVDKCLAKDPDKRYQNMAAIAEELGAIDFSFEETRAGESDYEKNSLNTKKQSSFFIIAIAASSVILIAILAYLAYFLFFVSESNEISESKELAPIVEHRSNYIKGDVTVWHILKGKLKENQLKYLSKPKEKIERLQLSKTDINDNNLKYIENLPLKMLDLRETSIGDQGLKSLKNLRSLRSLLLDKTRITDQGLSDLIKLKELMVLSLRDTKVTKRGIAILSTMKSLCYIDLSGSSVNDEAVDYLHRMSNLQFIGIANTRITASKFLNYKGRKNALLGLNISNLGVVDKDLLFFRPSTLDLHYLILRDNPSITDRGLLDIAQQRFIQSLDIRGCPKITDAGIARLQNEFPGETEREILTDKHPDRSDDSEWYLDFESYDQKNIDHLSDIEDWKVKQKRD